MRLGNYSILIEFANSDRVSKMDAWQVIGDNAVVFVYRSLPSYGLFSMFLCPHFNFSFLALGIFNFPYYNVIFKEF